MITVQANQQKRYLARPRNLALSGANGRSGLFVPFPADMALSLEDARALEDIVKDSMSKQFLVICRLALFGHTGRNGRPAVLHVGMV